MCLEILTQGRSPLLSVKISLFDVFKQLLTLHKLTPTSDATSMRKSKLYCKIFKPFCDVLGFNYETGKKQLRIFAGFSLVQPESPRYCAKFTTLCNNICRNTARIDHELVKNTPNAARIGHELTEIRDDSPRFARFSLTTVIKKAHTCFRGISSKMNVTRKAAVEFILQLEC